MLSSVIRSAKRPASLLNMATRGFYTAETKPYVFINKHTKVLVQGMTGQHVSQPVSEIMPFYLLLGNLPH